MNYSLRLLLLTSLLAFGSLNAGAFCRIETAHKIYRPEKTLGLGVKDIIKNSNCPQKIQRKFTSMVLSSKGSFNSRTLRNSFDGHKVDITPSKIRVYVLNKKLKSFFNLSKNWHWTDVKGLNKKQAFLLNEEEQLIFHCPNCRFTGAKRVQVDISNPIQNKVKRNWLQGKVIVRTKALVAIHNQSVTNKGIVPSHFELKLTDTTHPEKLFTNQNKLIFYKLNKPIQEGKALNYTDLVPVNLVTTGKPVKIVYDRENIALSGIAIPTNSGRFGDTIQLRNPNNKRIILGKVIDFNKVMVEL